MSDSAPLVYQAHPVTGEYVGSCPADPDPLEKGRWVVPGMAFLEAPPEPKVGFAVVHIEGEEQVWRLVQDHRGTAYLVSTGEAVHWDQLGVLPSDLTSQARPGPYHVWKDEAWQLDSVAEQKALTSQAFLARDKLLVEATTRIAPLQDAVDLGDASGEEEEELEAWKRYRVALNRVQRQATFPATIEWPTPPVIHHSQ